MLLLFLRSKLMIAHIGFGVGNDLFNSDNTIISANIVRGEGEIGF